MRLLPLSLLAAFASLFCAPCHAEGDEPVGKEAAELIAKSAFCIAYAYRDSDERDKRPALPEDPFRTGEDVVFEGSILSKGQAVVDVAALTSRATAHARVLKTQISRLTTAVLKTDALYPIAECYEPHHAFVFYSAHGEPLCCVEICFTCARFKTSPKLRETTIEEELRAVVGADFLEIAKILDELKLPLTPYKSFEELKKVLTEKEQQSKVRILADEKAVAAEKLKEGK